MEGFEMFNDKPQAFLGVNSEGENSAEISEVTKESAAEKAGLKKGDIITKIDDKKIENFEDVVEAVSAHKPKDEVTIYYKRDGKENSTKAVLGERKNEMAFSFSAPRLKELRVPGVPMAPVAPRWNMEEFRNNQERYGDLAETYSDAFGSFSRGPKLGLKIQDLEEEDGVKVINVEAGSAADKAGLKKDDIITEVGFAKVKNTDDAREQFHENADKASYKVKVKRDGKEMSFDIKIPKKLKTTNL
jgi:serine protease Do